MPQESGFVRRITSPRPSRSASGLSKTRFVNGDCVQVEKMSDDRGRPLAFATEHEGPTLFYTATLNAPVPPGGLVAITTQGHVTGMVTRLANGVWEYREQHWPATCLDTRRVEVYRLPPGAKVLETKPAGLLQERVVDGRTTLRVDKIIPPGGNISLEFRYRLPEAK